LLLSHWLKIVSEWRPAFVQERLWRRAVAQALGTLTAFGRRTLSRAICALSHQHQDWSADYRLHARAAWNPHLLFQPILSRALPWCNGRYLAVAIDDTRIHKTGRKIPTAFYQRDPLSPKFRFNLMLGLRFLQLAVLVPLYRRADTSPRSLPVRFEEVPPVKKPRPKASQEEWATFRLAVKQHNLSTRSVEVIRDLRTSLDEVGAANQQLLIVGDGSFCNRTLFTAALERTEIIARSRRDLRLCRPAASSQARRIYDSAKFTPEQVRQDEQVPWQDVKTFHGGRWRTIRFKQVSNILWQTGASQRLLRLFVIAPIPYYVPHRGRNHYHQPAFLLTTDLIGSAQELLQPYFDRWQIEVNHREEKDTLGIGQAQLRSPGSVPRQPAFVVAAYSALLLASLETFGAGRGDAYEPLPKWRRNAERPSCLDLIALLRKEMVANKHLLESFGFQSSWQALGLTAAA
jgi:hypothetical protein